MLHIYILRCSSFMQVKCNWYRMGTILLTAKNNNCKKKKAPLPEAAQVLFFKKIVHRI